MSAIPWRMLNFIGKFQRLFRSVSQINALIQVRQDFEVTKLWHLWPNRELNPLTRNPRKYYSQSDEDGILENFLFRLGQSKPGNVIEFGVGDGI